MAVVALVAAAGSGERLGRGEPKAFVPCGGRPLLEWSLDVLSGACDRVVVAVPPGYEDGRDRVRGAASRSASVRDALLAAPEAEIVVVHDAARPLVTRELVERCVAAVRDGWEGAVAAVRVTDTIKQAAPRGRVVRTLERASLWSIQTPQAFRAEALRRALDVPDAVLSAATDDASLVEAAGGAVRVIEASPENIKVTSSLDLGLAQTLLRARRGEGPPVLTDYHVHLRQDDPACSAADHFTAANATLYREAAERRGIAELGVSEHVHRFEQALAVWRHPFWEANAVDDLDAYCAFVRETTTLRLGIEADFVPGREDRMAELLAARDFDYVIGSVHFIGERAVDMEGDWDVWDPGQNDPERVWRRYFETLGEAARSGLFDVLAHPDLVKVWGFRRSRPGGDLRRFYDRAMEGIAESDVAIEVSTAGLRKPVGEIYPAPQFLRMCVEAGRPVALSSDAHVPGHVGFRYEDAAELLGSLGVSEIATFERRERRMAALG